MCGIVGALVPEHRTFITKATECISHRGPDGKNTFSDDFVSFGHTRLAILDLSENGAQPMSSFDERYVLIFNGEIYNHQEIRAKLTGKYTFKSTSDTETILYGYAEYGSGLFNKLNGIFALAIYDRQKKEIIIVRDQFGVKPLYYYASGNDFIFGSEIKSFLSYQGMDKSIDVKALVDYVTFLWAPAPRTPFLKVRKLPPGHFITVNAVSPASWKLSKYYELPFDGRYSKHSESALIDELDQKLFSAVSSQLLSDVPVGFFLSGGLDSSAVVAMASKAMGGERMQCYTINQPDTKTFDGFEDDLKYAEIVAKRYNANLIKIDARPPDPASFDQMIWSLDEPQADSAPLNVLNISRAARAQGYKVLLGGTAGDDLFSGYRRHQSLYWDRLFNAIPRPALTTSAKLLQALSSNSPTARRVNKIADSMLYNGEERLANLYTWGPRDAIFSLFSESIKLEIKNYVPVSTLIGSLENISEEGAPLNKMLYWDIKYFLADHNLAYTDKLSMAAGVEVRVPFLDKPLLEFACNLPVSLKMRRTTTKYLLKKVMERYLPNEVIYRPKSGFGAPVREWITGSWSNDVNERLSTAALKETGVFDPEAVQELIKENKKNTIDGSYTIWSIMAIQSWMKQFC